MTTRSISNTSNAVEEELPELPVGRRVCMHVVGIGRTDGRVMRSASALAGAGCLVSLVDVETEGRPAREVVQGVLLKHVLLPTWYSSRKNELSFAFRALQMLIWSTLLLWKDNADVYHAHDVMALPACLVAAGLRRKPVVFDAHELPPVETSVALWRKMHGLVKWLLARILPHCAGVITVSSPIAEEIRRRYHVRRVTLVRNFPPYQEVEKTDRIRQYLDLGSETRIALYQGNIQPDRGLDLLVHMAPFVDPDTMIVLMGKPVGGTDVHLEKLIAEKNLTGRVRLIPPVERAVLLEWTSSADIGLSLMPPDYSLNTRWMLPNKVFEYFMAGLPVLSSPLVAIAEILEVYQLGQVVPELEPQQVASALNALLADKLALAMMRQNALEAARRDLCWEKEQIHLLELYADILVPKVAR